MSIPLLWWDAPGPYEVAFSTRRGGVSTAPYDSLNLGRLTNDAAENAEENRRRLCAAVGADYERLAMNRQVHAATVNRARAGERGREGDGLWTEEPGLPMVKLTADCLPVALVRLDGAPGLALLHAGRLGLLEGILEAGVAALGGGRFAAAIGPGIGPCCYEVGDEIADTYRRRFGAGAVRERNLDLWSVAGRILRKEGATSVERIDVCTACSDEFFSHRRDRGVTGRQGVIGYVA
ncbi:MAG TPA: polyphenol oxidase family protein [Gaiellaceae bacterium]|jgi:YfiH family protein|nr:polyphenol oxidase family protein [Gaiellaceae bacterium]